MGFASEDEGRMLRSARDAAVNAPAARGATRHGIVTVASSRRCKVGAAPAHDRPPTMTAELATDEILRRIVGLSPPEIARLRRDGVVA